MATKEEREVLTEFIKVYQDNPCLWDMAADIYRDKPMKQAALGRLTKVMKQLDPEANNASTKKKVDNLRSAYFRELRKVRASELKAKDKSEVLVPNLWYFKLMSFLNSKDWGPGHRVPDPLRCYVKQAATSDEESVESAELLVLEPEPEPVIPLKRRSYSSSQGSSRKAKQPTIQSIHTYAESVNVEPKLQEEKKPNYFGIYVGEQLDEVSTFQRHVAERLISEVLFLAKTGNLSYESKIEKSSQEYDVSLSPRMEIECENTENEEETPRTLLKDLLTDGMGERSRVIE